MAQKWSILDQKWPNIRYRGIVAIQGNYPQKCCHSAVVQKGLKWIKMNFLPQMDKVGFGGGASEPKLYLPLL